MKKKKIKELLVHLYYYALYDGADIINGKNDKFMGNLQARFDDRDIKIAEFYTKLKELL